MDIIFTPWRQPYITGKKEPGCILCEKHALPAEKDAENLVLWRGHACYVLLNRYPYTNGHMMIAPYDHLASLELLAPPVANELTALGQFCLLVLRRAYHPEGFNLGINIGRVAGAGVPEHVHMHVVPRWGGDVNFMSAVADTRLIPEDLGQTLERLSEAWREEMASRRALPGEPPKRRRSRP